MPNGQMSLGAITQPMGSLFVARQPARTETNRKETGTLKQLLSRAKEERLIRKDASQRHRGREGRKQAKERAMGERRARQPRP